MLHMYIFEANAPAEVIWMHKNGFCDFTFENMVFICDH